jgi:FecR protein
MRHLQLAIVSATVIGILGPTGAQAAVRVGGALVVERDVLGSLSGQGWRPKFRGSDVYEAEFIRTGPASNAVLDFVDKTQLELGPTATMKVDRVVFNPNRSVRTLMVNAEGGAVRWISGESGSDAYQVSTPDVTITPEGTIFDVFVTPQRTVVVLQEGRIRVCSAKAPQACRVLSQPGEMIIGAPGSLEGPRRGGPTQSEFASRCLSAASQNCMLLASVTPPPREPPPPSRPQDYRRSGGTKSGTYRTQSDVAPRTSPSLQHRDYQPSIRPRGTYSRWHYRHAIAVPSGRYPVPSGRYVVPSGRYPVPSGRYAVPSGRYVVPSGRYVVPSGRYAVPSGRYAVPSGRYVVPRRPIFAGPYPRVARALSIGPRMTCRFCRRY